MLEEILAGKKTDDPLASWMANHKDDFRLKEDADPVLVNKIVTEGYAPDLTDIELIEIGKDPFLVAHALARYGERCVVTAEVSAPSKQRANRRLPDVCKTFGVQCQNPFQVYRDLGFRTAWKK